MEGRTGRISMIDSETLEIKDWMNIKEMWDSIPHYQTDYDIYLRFWNKKSVQIDGELNKQDLQMLIQIMEYLENA
jgi:hypothetical protein